MALASSGLLTPDENNALWDVIKQSHRKNQTLSLAVVKFYTSDQAAGKCSQCITKINFIDNLFVSSPPKCIRL